MSQRRHLHGLRVLFLLAAGLAASACVTKPTNSRVIGSRDGRRPTGDARPSAVPDVLASEPPDAGPPDGPDPLGPAGACERGDQCESGYCVEGVCCNVACGGSCVSCTQPGRIGECVPVPAGVEDPRNGCRRDGADSCRQSGFCNGRGGCAQYPTGTACAPSACAGPRTFLPAGECDGDGTCVMGAPLECTPFNCENAACRASCVSDSDCVPPNVCAAGKCGLRGNGQACTASDQCLSKFCVDGVCCEEACTGRCSFCASPASRGTCAEVRMGAPDPRAAAGVSDPSKVCLDQGTASCGTNGRCDGEGGCLRYDDGTVCREARCESSANAQFAQSVCEDGSCRSPAGTSCAPFRGCAGARCLTECSSDSRCISGLFCIDESCEKKPQGSSCEEDTDCLTGICAQGRCCNEACDSDCRSCNLEGRRGVCSVRTFEEEIDTDEDNVLEPEPVYFNDGDDVPPGTYTISYVSGCNKYAPDQGWTVNATDETGCCSWYLIGATPADKKLVMPGNVGLTAGMGAHVEFAACEAASRTAPARTYTHPGGPLGVFLQDAGYEDNVPGEDDENPVWRISGTLTCP